jgi:hypothetical protein
MVRSTKMATPAEVLPDGVDSEIERISAMNAGQLRAYWREMFGVEPPPAFSRDLLARGLAYRLQERAYGGLAPQTARLLRSLTFAPGTEPPRRVKVGSVIVREHKGMLHEVMVVPGGFCWRGATYGSLSTIARKITGVSWNGPRFFGLRTKEEARTPKSPEASGDNIVGKTRAASQIERPGRRSSVRMRGAL